MRVEGVKNCMVVSTYHADTQLSSQSVSIKVIPVSIM